MIIKKNYKKKTKSRNQLLYKFQMNAITVEKPTASIKWEDNEIDWKPTFNIPLKSTIDTNFLSF
jgi:hypothetical protein